MRDYHINSFCIEADREYIADVPDLDACSVFGKTPAEVLKQAEAAKRAWLAVASAENKPIPKPRLSHPAHPTRQPK